MLSSDIDKLLKVHVFPVGNGYYGDHPMSQWVNMVLVADVSYTDEEVREHIVTESADIGVYHRDDIFAMIPSMARRFNDVIVHLDPLA